MKSASNVSEWLPWLGRVRFLVITFLILVVVAIRQWTPISLPVGTLVPLAGVWYVLATAYVILRAKFREAAWHAPLQMALDLGVITCVVYSSGAQDSYFISLYLLAILMGSILFSRRGAFLVAGVSFVLLGCVVELAYYGLIPRGTASVPAARALEFWLASNLFAFFAVAYLGGLLAETIRHKGVELEAKSEALMDLQAFNHDIIESMRGGLATTGLDGQILLVNRAGGEITGYRSGALHGQKIADVFPGLWPVEMNEQGVPVALRQEIEMRTPGGSKRYLGVSISPLRTGHDERTGFVFNFQDLTELRRLEREVATKERMAAVGRLSAAIAHEIRQPLTAMTGALKELARLAPLEDDDRKLVQIVSRESQRLNQIITDFLDYSRERTYAFADVDIAAVVEETLLLLRRDAGTSGKYRFEVRYAARNLQARADRDAIRQVFWNLCNNGLRAMPDGGVLAVVLDGNSSWIRIAVRDTGTGLDAAEAARIFEPFQSGFVGGTGLGLAIVYQILQAHRGHILVETAKGQGASFIVELPRATRAPLAARSPTVAEEERMHPVAKG